jgi:hypothetical protein
MKRRVIISFIYAVLLLVSCQTVGKYSFEEVTYVSSFDGEVRVSPENSKTVELNLDGIQGIKIYGPYIIVSSESEEGLISIFEKKAPYRKLGSFFKKGNGPGELIYPFLPGGFNYYTSENGTIYADINNRAGKLIRFNISESIEEGKTVSEVIGTAEKTSFDVIDLGDDGIFYKTMSPERDRQIRFVEKDGQTYSTKGMTILNSARIKNKNDDGSRYNVLSGGVKYAPDIKCFIETPGEINAIHMYSLDYSVIKTFCIGDKLYDYNEIADRPEGERPQTSICTRLYDYYLAVLYLDIPLQELSLDSWRPTLILFYWESGDMVKVYLPDRVTSFDMDEETLSIFAYNADSEKLYVYDVSGM